MSLNQTIKVKTFNDANFEGSPENTNCLAFLKNDSKK